MYKRQEWLKLYGVLLGREEQANSCFAGQVKQLEQMCIRDRDYDFEAHKELVPMQPGDVPVTFADTEPLERDFSFKPHTPLREGCLLYTSP